MQFDNLPEGWCSSRIADLSMKGEQRKPADDEIFTYVDIGSINRDLKCIESPQKIIGKDAPSRARKIINTGDVLVSLTRPNLNAVALVPRKLDNQIASTGFEVIKTILVDGRYIFALTRSEDFINSISGVVQGALYPAAKSSDVQAYKIPLPPLAEQKVIADKLDTLLAQVDTTKARLERIPQILKTFRQSVLAAAVSGKLTEVSIAKLGELNQCAKIVSGLAFKKSQYSNSGSRLLQIANVGHGKTKWEDCNFIPSELARECEFFSMADGDIVLALNRPITNETLKVAWVKFSDLPATLYQRVARIRCNGNGLNAEYLFLLMQSPGFLKKVEINLKGSDQPYLNTSDLASFEIYAPDEIQQTEIVRRVEELFAFADTIEQKAATALERVNNLTQSILAKAFRGELTADWRAANPELIRGENSAEALLKKIQAEREALSLNKKSRTRENSQPNKSPHA